jgi:hypothetical protein
MLSLLAANFGPARLAGPLRVLRVSPTESDMYATVPVTVTVAALLVTLAQSPWPLLRSLAA